MMSETTIEKIEFKERVYFKTSYLGVECICDDNEYYNLTKIAQACGISDINKITRYQYWKGYIEEVKDLCVYNTETKQIEPKVDTPKQSSQNYIEISDNLICYSIEKQKGDKSILNGVYYDSIFVHHFLEHVNKKYAIKIGFLLKKLNQELKLRNITLDEKISEYETKIQQMQDEHTVYKSKVNFAKNHERAGCISLIKTQIPTHYLLRYCEIPHRETSKSEIVFNDIYNPESVYRLILFYSKHSVLPGVKHIATNTIEVTNIDNFRNCIELIGEHKVEIPDLQTQISEFFKRKKTLESDRNYIRAQLFEVYCSSEFEIPLYKYEATELLSLSKRDKGIDLLSIKNKQMGQCKFYEHSSITVSKIRSFINFCEEFQDFERYLFINDSCIINSDVQELEDIGLFEIIKVDELKFKAFYDKCIENKPEMKVIDDKLLLAREWLKQQLEENEKIYLDDVIIEIRKRFEIEIPNDIAFGHYFSDLIYHDSHNLTIPKDENGRKYIRSIVNRNDEIEFIKNYIKQGQYTIEEYLPLHNKQFKTNYISHGFGQKFGYLFKRTAKGKLQKKDLNNKKSVLILELAEDKTDIFQSFIEQRKYDVNEKSKEKRNKALNECMLKLLNDFNSYFHRYETTSSFRKLLKELGYENLIPQWH